MKKLLLLLAVPAISFAQTKTDDIAAKAAKIHEKAYTIDTHADVPINMMKPGQAWKMAGRSAEI